jgi:hypothetical protein
VKLFHQRSVFVVRGRKREVIYLVQAVYLFTQDSTSTVEQKSPLLTRAITSSNQLVVFKGWCQKGGVE